MAKRGNGDGSISRWKNSWRGQLVIGFTTDGRPIRRSVTGKTRQEAREKLDKLKRDHADGRIVATDGHNMTVGELLTKWLADRVAVDNDANTLRCYSRCVRLHIVPVIGTVKLTKLVPVMVDELLADMARNNIGARTRQLTWYSLRKALKQAVSWRLIAVNPTDSVPRPKTARREHSILTGDQIAKVLAEAKKNRLYAFWYLAIVTGMRRGELAGLKWADIDFDNHHLTVRRQVVYANGAGPGRVKEAKTARSHRKIDLPAEAIPVLKAHQAQSLREGHAGEPWVFLTKAKTKNGRSTFVNPSTVWRIHKRTLERAGVPHVRMHDLRHSHATLLLLAGINPKVVQERLGHSTIGTTMDIYSHVLPSMQREAADAIGRLVKAPA